MGESLFKLTLENDFIFIFILFGSLVFLTIAYIYYRCNGTININDDFNIKEFISSEDGDSVEIIEKHLLKDRFFVFCKDSEDFKTYIFQRRIFTNRYSFDGSADSSSNPDFYAYKSASETIVVIYGTNLDGEFLYYELLRGNKKIRKNIEKGYIFDIYYISFLDMKEAHKIDGEYVFKEFENESPLREDIYFYKNFIFYDKDGNQTKVF